jgi:hypothetical protein
MHRTRGPMRLRPCSTDGRWVPDCPVERIPVIVSESLGSSPVCGYLQTGFHQDFAARARFHLRALLWPEAWLDSTVLLEENELSAACRTVLSLTRMYRYLAWAQLHPWHLRFLLPGAKKGSHASAQNENWTERAQYLTIGRICEELLQLRGQQDRSGIFPTTSIPNVGIRQDWKLLPFTSQHD